MLLLSGSRQRGQLVDSAVVVIDKVLVQNLIVPSVEKILSNKEGTVLQFLCCILPAVSLAIIGRESNDKNELD